MSGEFGIINVLFILLGIMLGVVSFTLSLFLFPVASDCVIMLSPSLVFLLLLSFSFFFFSSSWLFSSSVSDSASLSSVSDSTSLSSFLLELSSLAIGEVFSNPFSSKFTVRDFFLLDCWGTSLKWFDHR
uniref:Uncharacterized protein n=1 Tax=Cacopsylla melanoneura TaxID=428564 RepID=A0A8D8ZSV5_9HEMI